MPITRAQIYGGPRSKTGDLRKVHRKSARPCLSCRPECVCEGPVVAVTNDHQRRPVGVGRLKQQKCMFSPSGGLKPEVTVLTTTGRLWGGPSCLSRCCQLEVSVSQIFLPYKNASHGFQARPQFTPTSSPGAQLDPPALTLLPNTGSGAGLEHVFMGGHKSQLHRREPAFIRQILTGLYCAPGSVLGPGDPGSSRQWPRPLGAASPGRGYGGLQHPPSAIQGALTWPA